MPASSASAESFEDASPAADARAGVELSGESEGVVFQPLASRAHWVPDDEVVACPLCYQDFSFTKRKHHCRICGRVVCSECSPHRVRVQGFAGKVRICDDCEAGDRDARAAELTEVLDAKKNINMTLKAALKEKHEEVESFKAFLLALTDDFLNDDEIPSYSRSSDMDSVNFMKLMGHCQARINKLSEEHRKSLSEVQALRAEEAEKEQNSRLLAQRTLRAERELARLASVEAEKNSLQEQLSEAQRAHALLHERINRLQSEVASAQLEKQLGARVATGRPVLSASCVSTAAHSENVHEFAPSAQEDRLAGCRRFAESCVVM